MTPRELEIATLNADLADQGRADREPAQIIDITERLRQRARRTHVAQTEADYWAQRHNDGDDCA